MFYCALHNWTSYEKCCPACFPIVVSYATTTTSPEPPPKPIPEWEKPQPKQNKENLALHFLEQLKDDCKSDLSLIGGGEMMKKKIDEFLTQHKNEL